MMAVYSKEFLKNLFEGKLDDWTVKEVMSAEKDQDRFDKWLTILQERVKWKECILLPLGEHLYIVQKGKERIVKCECGYEFGDYRVNWKLSALIYVRDTEDKLDEVYPGKRKPQPQSIGWCEVREFYCPGCGTQLEVENVPAGYPVNFDFLPDLDVFYDRWLGKPLESKEISEDRTYEVTRVWGTE
jgi:acetone carboxylase gamma subunit